jgi:hypothetical protein
MKTQIARNEKGAKLKLDKKTILRLDRKLDSSIKNGFFFQTWDDITGCTSRMTNDCAGRTK